MASTFAEGGHSMSTPHLILVTGATGKIGSCIAGQLQRMGREIRLLARDPNKLSDFPGADKVKGDYGEVATLDRAFAGVLSAFIVSGYAEPGKRAKLHRNAFHAAHYESERFLKATGVPHTILQDSFYSELAVQMFDEEGVMKGPGGQGKVSWVGRKEIAEVAAKLLASDKPLLGTFPMTGTSALSLSETAALLSSLKPRTLHYEDEP